MILPNGYILFSKKQRYVSVKNGKNVLGSQNDASSSTNNVGSGDFNKDIKISRREIRELKEYYNNIDRAISKGESVDRVGEWLWDNYEMICDRIKTVMQDSRKKCRQLPAMPNGTKRLLSIASSYIDNSNGKISAKGLTDYVNSIGSSVDLTVEEAWSLRYAIELALLKSIVILISRQLWLQKQQKRVQKAVDTVCYGDADDVAGLISLTNGQASGTGGLIVRCGA